MIVKTSTAAQTNKLAASLLVQLKGGDVIALSGNLGAGKTTFVQGLAKALGIKKYITSPTFLLLKAYLVPPSAAPKHKTIKQLVHVDAYRLETERDLQEIGLFDYMGQPDTLTVIEWAEKIPKALPKNTIWIKIKIVPQGDGSGQGTGRIFSIKMPA